MASTWVREHYALLAAAFLILLPAVLLVRSCGTRSDEPEVGERAVPPPIDPPAVPPHVSDAVEAGPAVPVECDAAKLWFSDEGPAKGDDPKAKRKAFVDYFKARTSDCIDGIDAMVKHETPNTPSSIPLRLGPALFHMKLCVSCSENREPCDDASKELHEAEAQLREYRSGASKLK